MATTMISASRSIEEIGVRRNLLEDLALKRQGVRLDYCMSHGGS